VSDFFDVVTRQRACRDFTDEPVDDGQLAQMLRAATSAPSAENKQPWEFVVVRDDSIRRAIGDLMVRAWESGGRASSQRRLSPAVLADVERGVTRGFVRAPVMIVVGADTGRALEVTVPSSIFPAVQNLLLAATALGLGSALTTIATGYREELQGLLALPQEIWPVAVVPVGNPARPLAPARREPFEQHTHRDRYGHRWV
jgi:nitroreductase